MLIENNGVLFQLYHIILKNSISMDISELEIYAIVYILKNEIYSLFIHYKGGFDNPHGVVGDFNFLGCEESNTP